MRFEISRSINTELDVDGVVSRFEISRNVNSELDVDGNFLEVIPRRER